MPKRKEGEIAPAYILWAYSANNEGKHPVKVRVTHQRKRDYYPVFLSDRQKLFLTKFEYDQITSTPLAKLRGNNRVIRNAMEEAVQMARVAVEDSTNKGKTPFSFGKFEREYLGADSSKSFLAFFKAHIERLGTRGQAGTVRTYSSALSAFREFLKNKDIDPADLTPLMLQEFDAWLREGHTIFRSGKKITVNAKNDTSISIYMRCLRSIYNEMAANDSYLLSSYPFSKANQDKKYKIPQPSGQKGQTLDRSQLMEFIHGKIEGDKVVENPMFRAKQLFLFSFFGQGMNFKDMALLRFSDIGNDTIEFDRQKTIRTRSQGRKIKIPLSDELRRILVEQSNPEKNKKANFVFEVFTPAESLSEKGKDDRIRQWIKTTNKWLKRYCRFNKIPEVSTYASRHTFASLAKSHISVAMISEMLGHSRVATTQIYLGRFDDEESRTGLMKVFKGLSKQG